MGQVVNSNIDLNSFASPQNPLTIKSFYPCKNQKSNSNRCEKYIRRRSVWFYLANDELYRVKDLGSENLELDTILSYFDRWRTEYKEKYTALMINLNKCDYWLFIKQYSRFERNYKKKLKKKLEKLNGVEWDLKVELTLDPKEYLTLGSEFDSIKKEWDRLRAWFRKRFGVFQFVCVLETSKKGRPHLHILFSFENWRVKAQFRSRKKEFWSEFNRDLYRIWGSRIHTRRIYNRNNLKTVGYVLKYVNKTLDMDIRENKVFSALLFASNKRLFSLSRGLVSLVNSDKVKLPKAGYVYVGSVYVHDLEIFCKDKSIELKDYIYVMVTSEDYYKYPALFGVGNF